MCVLLCYVILPVKFLVHELEPTVSQMSSTKHREMSVKAVYY